MLNQGQIVFNDSSQGNQDTSLVVEAREEAIKDLVIEEEKSKQKLDELVQKSNKVLLRISTVFPFDFFPNDIIIDEQKVNIIFREFFWSEQIHSVMIKDISDVMVETNPFFATLVIVDEGFTEEEIRIPNFWKGEALEARKIIQGLIVSFKGSISPMLGGVGLSSMGEQELLSKLESLGEAVK